MEYGKVVRIRVNPADIMSCIDICKKARVYIDGMSLGQVVRLSLSGLLEAARDHGVIERRDGFEYSEMVRPFEVRDNTRKLEITTIMRDVEMGRIAADKPASSMNLSFARGSRGDLRDDAPELSDKIVRARGKMLWRINELVIKERDNPLNWSEEDAHELAGLRAQYDETERQINNGRQA